MSAWSNQRKILYGGGLLAVLVVLVGIPIWKTVYKAPTCFDGKQNGDERGLDCGGSCQKLCSTDFFAPNVSWSRLEKITPKLYNVATYIINPNVNGEAKNVPYHVEIYDGKGIIITSYDGTVTIPPHRNTLAFRDMVDVAERLPSRAVFEFTGVPNWNKVEDSLGSLVIENKNYTEDLDSSSLTVDLRNSSFNTIGRMSVYAALYDKDSNVIGFSKTIVDNIAGKATEQASFTWPISRQGKVISIEILPVAE